MSRRPLQLREVPLRTVFRGYSKAEVRALLDAASPDYAHALEEVGRLRDAHAGLLRELQQAQERERDAMRVLTQAERDAAGLRDGAARRADELIAAAERRAEALVHDLEADRAYQLGRIARCHDRRSRAAQLLEGEIRGLRDAVSPDTADHRATVVVPAPTADVPPTTETDGEPDPWAEVDIDALTALASQPPDSEPPPAVSPRERPTASYEPPTPEPVPAPEPSRSDSLFARSYPLATQPEISTRRRFGRYAAVAASLAAVGIVSAVALPHREANKPRQVVQSAKSSPAPEQPVPTLVTSPAETAATAGAAAPAAEPVAPDTLRLRLQATRDCWIKMTIGDESDSMLLEAGTELTREASSDIVLLVGNAGALVVTVNGEPIPPLGREGQVVSRRITRPGSLPVG